MKEERITVRIRGARVDLPVYADPESTLRIAAAVEKKLADVEAEGGPIDTFAYALRAACDYAAALSTLQQEQARDEQQLLKLIEHLRSRLESLAQDG